LNSNINVVKAESYSSFTTDVLISYVNSFIPIENDRFIIVNSPTWTLHLIDKDGNELDRAGRIGRGPGELQQINNVFLGNDGLLYVYDARSMRITSFSIKDDTISLSTEYNVGMYQGEYQINEIMATSSSIFGVYKSILTSNYLLVELNSDFSIDRELIHFSAQDFESQYSIRILFEDLSFQLVDQTFIYMNNYTLDYYLCDLDSLSCDLNLMNVGTRKLTENNINRLYRTMSLLNITDEVKRMGVMPWTTSVKFYKNHLIFHNNNYGDSTGENSYIYFLSVYGRTLSAIQLENNYEIRVLSSSNDKIILAASEKETYSFVKFIVLDSSYLSYF